MRFCDIAFPSGFYRDKYISTGSIRRVGFFEARSEFFEFEIAGMIHISEIKGIAKSTWWKLFSRYFSVLVRIESSVERFRIGCLFSGYVVFFCEERFYRRASLTLPVVQAPK